ncbi:TetR family transcriptional regulator [Gordonia soli]|uniref:Putative TetR family transcriptional regulator n=1 Tax=Gordonia soli NBRC 108243 TaxID=1223545 RepID=M0QFV3_9ACTN|nr:TetR family transcriptional regulator [Gordonia soli]GAC67191.1 putative TetR family transcriptional regulator [Gordonia soli NBRC 108243]
MTSDPHRPPVGARLRQARVEHGRSLRGLAAELGVSAATLSQIENGKSGLTVERLESVADALGTTAARILGSPDADRRAPQPAADRPLVFRAPEHPSERTADVRRSAGWRDYGPLELPPIPAAALAEFLEVGYHGTSMRRISARCGISVPGIYTRYESKQELLMSILDATMADLEWRADAAIAEGGDPVARFSLAVENLALYHIHRRELGFIGTSEVRALEPTNRAAVATRRNHQQRIVDQCVRDAVDAGEFRVDEPDDASRVVVTMCTAIPSWWQPHGRLGPDAVAQEYVGFALRLMGHES